MAIVIPSKALCAPWKFSLLSPSTPHAFTIDGLSTQYPPAPMGFHHLYFSSSDVPLSILNVLFALQLPGLPFHLHQSFLFLCLFPMQPMEMYLPYNSGASQHAWFNFVYCNRYSQCDLLRARETRCRLVGSFAEDRCLVHRSRTAICLSLKISVETKKSRCQFTKKGICVGVTWGTWLAV